MSSSPYSNIQIGSDVYTMDGDKLGTIKETRDTYFKVDAPMKPDFWLRAECIRGGDARAGRVVVAFDKDHLSDNKVKLDE